jgi:hypothetical protein
MKWRNLLLLFASLAFVIGAYADELDDLDIPDDIDDDELDEDEEILRMLETNRIVRNLNQHLAHLFINSFFRWRICAVRTKRHAKLRPNTKKNMAHFSAPIHH